MPHFIKHCRRISHNDIDAKRDLVRYSVRVEGLGLCGQNMIVADIKDRMVLDYNVLKL